jgi:hypothetical protein
MPKKGRAPQGFYTAKEAMEIISIPSASFYMLVNSGVLKRTIPPGRREGFYAKSEVNTYARNLQAMSGPGEKLDFGLALTEDLPAIRELTAHVAGGYAHAVPEDILKAWIRKNPQSIHIMRKEDEIVGYVSMFPVVKNTLIQRLEGKLLNRTIPIDDILPYSINETMPLYIAEMAVKHQDDYIENDEPIAGKPDIQARLRGARLIKETVRFIAGLKKQGTIIDEFYAVGTSKFGIQMCRDLGMIPMDLPTGVREDRIPFVLNFKENTESILVKRLLKA